MANPLNASVLRLIWKVFAGSKRKGAKIAHSPQRTAAIVNSVSQHLKAGTTGMGAALQQANTLVAMVKDYTSGRYKALSVKTLASIIGAFVYFLTPVDAIPDFVLGFGYIDDAFIIGLVFRQVSKEVDKYQQWKSMHTGTGN